jgi:hypothetical protein
MLAVRARSGARGSAAAALSRRQQRRRRPGGPAALAAAPSPPSPSLAAAPSSPPRRRPGGGPPAALALAEPSPSSPSLAAAPSPPRRRPGGGPPAALALAEPSPSSQAAEPSPSPPALPAPERYVPGAVLEINGPAEYAAVRAASPGRLVVLIAKARSCRPCKAFSRKFAALAAKFPEVAFLEIYGDDSRETRQMMISLAVRVTPTFRLTRGVAGEVAAAAAEGAAAAAAGPQSDGATVLTGTSETKLRDAIVAALTDSEKAAHPDEVEAWRRSREAAAEAAALEAVTQQRLAALSASSASAASSSADE